MLEPGLPHESCTKVRGPSMRRDRPCNLVGTDCREREALTPLAEGASNKVIGRRLGISVDTVKCHVASILEKLDATGRTDAVAHAARLGLILL